MKDLYDYDVSAEWLMFWHNGWESGENEREYLNKICAGYRHDVKAVWLASLRLDGDIGVGWVEVKPSEDDGTLETGYFASCDLDEMEYAMSITERMLLRQGIPFIADYEFTHDKGKRMRRLNLAIRRRLKVDEYVERERKREEKRWKKQEEEYKKEANK